ncbi:hypothetical protein NEIRO02_1877 [Nematocida sp. AWRm79]|nr:hypothetical protein NEIRO02_1877 [Nematocida sp. AWRm79]
MKRTLIGEYSIKNKPFSIRINTMGVIDRYRRFISIHRNNRIISRNVEFIVSYIFNDNVDVDSDENLTDTEVKCILAMVMYGIQVNINAIRNQNNNELKANLAKMSPDAVELIKKNLLEEGGEVQTLKTALDGTIKKYLYNMNRFSVDNDEETNLDCFYRHMDEFNHCKTFSCGEYVQNDLVQIHYNALAIRNVFNSNVKSEGGLYTLSDLYTKQKNGKYLIDYGLKCIYRNIHLLKGIAAGLKRIKDEEISKEEKIQSIERLMSLDDLRILRSICTYRNQILIERRFMRRLLEIDNLLHQEIDSDEIVSGEDGIDLYHEMREMAIEPKVFKYIIKQIIQTYARKYINNALHNTTETKETSKEEDIIMLDRAYAQFKEKVSELGIGNILSDELYDIFHDEAESILQDNKHPTDVDNKSTQKSSKEPEEIQLLDGYLKREFSTDKLNLAQKEYIVYKTKKRLADLGISIEKILEPLNTTETENSKESESEVNPDASKNELSNTISNTTETEKKEESESEVNEGGNKGTSVITKSKLRVALLLSTVSLIVITSTQFAPQLN